jgi:glycosyltransferase involved in cell wall biosynthesis
MRVCLLALEFFNWGKYGGIGKITRELAEGLVERGVEVSVVIPQGENQSTFERVNGVNVFGYPIWKISPGKRLVKMINADVYHSQDPIMATVTALESMPCRRHVVTFQNPKSKEDWLKVIRYYRPRRILYNTFFEPKVRKEINKCDRFFCHAKFTLVKVKKLYGIESDPFYLPNPVDVPYEDPIKSLEPMVLYLGRLDGEKNPERFIKLAGSFPDIKFILAGEAHNARRKVELSKIQKPGNLEKMGFVDGLLKNDLVEKSWVLVNPSFSECLPVAFLEALANGCAILSNHDPDKLTSRFGYHVKKDDFEKGLDYLLKKEKWRKLGIKGREYVRRVHKKYRVIDLHLEHYRDLLEN